ncbi:MAG: hypothetical protein R2865_15825 [Deinococcales bacterium]
MSLLEWWNIIFFLPLIIGCIDLVIALSGLGFEMAEGSHDAGDHGRNGLG